MKPKHSHSIQPDPAPPTILNNVNNTPAVYAYRPTSSLRSRRRLRRPSSSSSSGQPPRWNSRARSLPRKRRQWRRDPKEERGVYTSWCDSRCCDCVRCYYGQLRTWPCDVWIRFVAGCASTTLCGFLGGQQHRQRANFHIRLACVLRVRKVGRSTRVPLCARIRAASRTGSMCVPTFHPILKTQEGFVTTVAELRLLLALQIKSVSGVLSRSPPVESPLTHADATTRSLVQN